MASPTTSACIAPGVEYHAASDERSFQAIAAFLAAGGKATSDSKDETSMLIENGDRVVAVWTNRATLTGTIPKADGTEIAVTGTTLKHSGVTVGTVRDGKFATMRDYLDTGDIVRQLGLAPST